MMMKSELKAVLFDKDGTLIYLDDLWAQPTIDFIELQLNKATQLADDFNRENYYREIGIDNGKIIGNSLVAASTMDELAISISHITGVDAHEIKAEMLEFFTNFLETHPEKLIPVCDLKELFSRLKRRGLIIGIVTSDAYLTTMKALEILNIIDPLDFIATADDFAWKPNTQSLDHFAKKFELAFNQIVYVGDSVHDMQYAKNTRAAIGVLSGSTPKEMLLKETPYVIDSIKELLNLLEKI